ncbi:MAG: OmpH family outer membrane protein [Alphaproteobacteria bacterium]|nr:OmpH family outer membrane protein [Alphaproteobacteria bacterium]
MTQTIIARVIAGFVAVLLAGSISAVAQPKPPAPPKPGAAAPMGAVPIPKIVVIDRNVIIRLSKAGQDIVRQANGYMQSAQTQFRAEGLALQKESKSLQQQIAILAPDVKAKKIRDFQGKQAAFERKVGARQGLIQGGVYKARQQMEQALGPILQGIMQERGANLLLDRNSVVLGTVNVDITSVAIQRLNQKLPSVKVDLVALPANVQAQLAQQQQAARR